MDIDKIKADLKLGIMGQRIRAGNAKKPIGDRMINAVRGAINEAWEIGQGKSPNYIAPSEPSREPEPEDPYLGP